MTNSISNKIERIATETAAQLGFDLINIELLTHHNPISMQLQVQRMKDGEVSVDDCALLSGPIGEAIDCSNLLNQPYTLEISSPGIGDNLCSDRDFETFKGFPIEIVYRNKTDETQEMRRKGLLHLRDLNNVQINIKGRLERIPRKDVIKVRLTSTLG